MVKSHEIARGSTQFAILLMGAEITKGGIGSKKDKKLTFNIYLQEQYHRTGTP